MKTPEKLKIDLELFRTWLESYDSEKIYVQGEGKRLTVTPSVGFRIYQYLPTPKDAPASMNHMTWQLVHDTPSMSEAVEYFNNL